MSGSALKPQSAAHLGELYRRFPAVEPCRESVAEACAALIECFSNQGMVLACGNGGSAADAEHLVGELMNRYLLRRPIPQTDADKLRAMAGDDAESLITLLQRGAPAISLVSQSALSTAIANDASPEMVFAQQVYGYGRPGDVLIAFSTSGNSGNVVQAVHVARAKGMRTIGLTGRSGGRLAQLCDTIVCAPADRAFEVQELHLPIYHTLCAVVENELFGE
ncbi:MAG: SIS domain-containing protein [Chitinivibrionales bacterium]|nr:SIS domain-containing protein [Chitinivibrionales bacterium]